MIPIEEEKRIDWNAIRAEYIGGGTSYRRLVEKYNVSFETLKRRGKAEHWTKLRTQAEHTANTVATQRVVDAAVDNATIAAEVKKKLLLRLQRIEEKYPFDATEVRTKQGANQVIFKIRDLTAAYKDLTEDIQNTNGEENRLLKSLYELEKKLND